MTTRYEVAIRRADDGRVLLLSDRTLPSFSTDKPPAWQVVSIVLDEIRTRHGLSVTPLRAISAEPGADRLYEAEYAGGEVPAGASWVTDADLEGGLAARLVPGISGDRHPWYRPGWLAGMTAWIDDRLGDAGTRRRGPVRQVRSWGRAAVLTLGTDRGRMWVKAVPDAFSHEIAVTELLADIDPGIVPPVVAADRALGHIVTEHVDGPLLSSLGDEPEVWAATLSRVAEIQRVLAAERDGLAAAGTAAAPLAGLAERLPALLDDDALLLVDGPGGLTRDEVTTLRARIPELVGACRSLDASGIPDSLEHGDLAPDEVIVGEMGPVFLDWSDATITHPFLSAASLLSDGGPASGVDDRRAAAYLAPWMGAGLEIGATVGRDALALARVVLPLHLAAQYAERVLPGLEQRWELERVVPDALRTILRE